MPFSEEQITQLAPDDASAQAGRKLASIVHWETLNQHELALWGECKGSGKLPYFVKIDLVTLAYACSCPSRKFPCKHALGLLYLFARDPGKINKPSSLHPAVEEWLHKREQKSIAKENKPVAIVDEKAKQKRTEERSVKVADGITDLQQWLKDMMRTGISFIPKQKYQYFQNIAARLVDAQASGLANQVRELSEINYQSSDWHEHFMQACAHLYAMTVAYTHADRLDDKWKKELQSRIGWNISRDEVAGQQPIQDNWIILGIERKQFEKLTAEKTWLYGEKTGLIRYILNFIAIAQTQRQLLVEGTAVAGAAYPYPVIEQGRVLMDDTTATKVNWQSIKGIRSLQIVVDIVSDTLAINPFITEIPIILHEVQIWKQDDKLWIFDREQYCFPLQNSINEITQILAAYGGDMFSCLSIWNDKALHVVSHWSDNSLNTFK